MVQAMATVQLAGRCQALKSLREFQAEGRAGCRPSYTCYNAVGLQKSKAGDQYLALWQLMYEGSRGRSPACRSQQH